MKKVFISHSSEDFNFAKSLCDSLENQDISCWIAPRDIPYGEWSEKITIAIENSKIMVFIFSENSNKSKQVLREIKLAIENNVVIIPVRISSEEYNPSLKYFLALYQWDDVDSNDFRSMNKVVKKIKCLVNLKDYSESEMDGVSNSPEVEIIKGNFYELLAKSMTCDEENEPSSFKSKLLDRVGNKFMKEYFGFDEVHDSYDYNDNQVEKFNPQGYYFTINEKKSVRTLAFIVSKKFIEPNYQSKHIVEQLDYKISGIINKKVTYFVDYTDPLGNPLILISLLKDSNNVVVNMGFVNPETDSIMISNLPKVYEYKKIQSKKDDFVMKMEVEEDKTTIVIDYESFSCVPTKRYFDISKQEWVYYIELSKNKNYFTISISQPNDSEEIPVSFFIALGYYYGCYGLKKSIIDAAEWFEKCATKDAYYYLTEIFKKDPLLSDEDDYKYYLKKYNELSK